MKAKGEPMPATERDLVSYVPDRTRSTEEERDFGQDMLDTPEGAEHYQHELDERDLSFRERITQAYRELEPLMDSPKLLKFVLDAREDRLDQARIDDFVHGPGALHRVGEDSWQTVNDRLEEPGKLSGEDFQEFAREMGRQARLAQYELTDIKLKRGTGLMEEKLETVTRHIDENALHHLREKSQHHPPAQVHHPDPHVNAAWNRVEEERLQQLSARQETWPLMDQALQRREQAQEAFRRDGTLPEWLHPERFTKERVETAPEHRDLGYNHVHNRPIELDGAPGELETYLQERMETTLQWSGRLNGGEPPAQFSRYLILPYLDPLLAESPGDEASRERPDHSPLSHTQTTYARLVENCLHEQGIVEAAQQDRPDLLAEALRDNVRTIQRMTEYLREKQEEPPAQDAGLPNWDVRTQERWNAALELTSNLTDTAEMIKDVLKLEEHAAQATDRALELTTGHPAKYLIMEAIGDLQSARDALDRIDTQDGYHLVDQAVLTGHLDQLAEQFRDEHRGEGFIEEMMDRAEHHPLSMISEYRAQGYDEQMAQDLAEINAEVRGYQDAAPPDQQTLSERNAALAGMGPMDATRVEDLAELDPQRIVLFDQAVQLMAHAGFNLATVSADLD